MQQPIVLIWSLLEACRAGSEPEQDQAARACAAELSRPERAAAGIRIERLDAQLLIDDCPAASGAGEFAPSQGVLAFLRHARVAGVRLAPGVGAQALLQWARDVVHGGALPVASPAGVVTQMQHDASGPADLVPAECDRSSAGAAIGADSRLRSLFLQHRLLDGLPPLAGVDPVTQKLVVQGVVDRLLQLPGGLEPLMLLQRDDALLQRSTNVAVLTVLFAHRSGWPEDLLADLGAAGLLHDLGTVLNAAEPSLAAFHWLLERGDEDFWLRSALVARRYRDVGRAAEDPAGPLAAVALVRLAAAAEHEGEQGIVALGESGAATLELCQLARDTLAAC